MRKFAFIIALLLVSIGSRMARAGELLDRIVVTVNGKALLQSDWDEELHYELFMSGRAIAGSTTQDRESALNRIIDQELLREQVHAADFKAASSEEVEAQLALLKKQNEQERAGQSWTMRLQEYDLTDDQIRDHVQTELNQLRIIEARLRPSVQIDSADVERYYREKVASQAGGKPASAEVQGKIREILVQEKMNQLLDSWLESLRTQARIQHFTPNASAQDVRP